jgi:raffinose/stachyose/melibiose transport system substrate-binding protein
MDDALKRALNGTEREKEESMVRRVLVLASCLIVAFAVLATTGCGKSAKAEKVTLTYWLFGTPTTEADRGLPAEKWWITNAVKRFEAKNPKIKVEVVVLPQDNIAEKFKAAGVAKNGPDVSNMWAGGILFDNTDFILPIDKYITKDEAAQIAALDTFRAGYKADGTLYGLPYADQNDSLVLYYNKKILADAGVDIANMPTDMDGFLAVCDKVKKAGKTPMAIGDKEGYYSAFMMLPLLATATGSQGIRDILEGRTTFAGDADFVASAQAFQDLYKKGYTNKDVVSLDDSSGQALFNSGKAAMVVTGPCLIATALETLKTDLGMAKWVALRPDSKYKGAMCGGPGQGFVVTSYSKHPEEAVKFMKYLVGKDEGSRMITERNHGTGATPYKYISADVFTDPFSKQLVEFNKTAPVSVYWPDNQMPSEVSAELYRMSPLLLSGSLSAVDFAKKLDEALAKTLKK